MLLAASSHQACPAAGTVLRNRSFVCSTVKTSMKPTVPERRITFRKRVTFARPKTEIFFKRLSALNALICGNVQNDGCFTSPVSFGTRIPVPRMASVYFLTLYLKYFVSNFSCGVKWRDGY
jgi:hypothetical protein